MVLTNDKGLGPADEATYRTLVDTLRQDTRDVLMLQDFVSTPALRSAVTSKDHKAWVLPVGVAGELGTPSSYAAFNRIDGIVQRVVSGTPLTVNLTGPAATVADLTVAGARDRMPIELAIAVLVLVVLLMIYRSAVTMLLPLLSIGTSLVIAQAVVAGYSQLTGSGVSNQSVVFLSAIMAGAGTDYAVFLISRYHDYLRSGANSDEAVQRAMFSIGKVIAASAATVGITFLLISFARMGVFKTVGASAAIGIGVAFLAAVTLLPAILVLAGRRGWVKPRRELTTRFWRRSGIRIVRRPKVNLIASVLVLIVLASCAGLVRYNYDDRKALRTSAPSSIGYAALDRHFPVNQSIPQYILVQSPHDLRTPKALADLEQMADRVSQLPNVAAVSGITRPTGNVPEQFRATYQAGAIGTLLADGSTLIKRSHRRPQPVGRRRGHAGRQPRQRARPGRPARRECAGTGERLRVGEEPVQRRRAGETGRPHGPARRPCQRDQQFHGLELLGGQERLRLDRPGAGGAAGQPAMRCRSVVQRHPRGVRATGRPAKPSGPRCDQRVGPSTAGVPGQTDAQGVDRPRARLAGQAHQGVALHGVGQTRWHANESEHCARRREPIGRWQPPGGRRRCSTRRPTQAAR